MGWVVYGGMFWFMVNLVVYGWLCLFLVGSGGLWLVPGAVPDKVPDKVPDEMVYGGFSLQCPVGAR